MSNDRFLANLSKVETKFASGMDLEAGKGVKVRDIFVSLRKLGNGEYKTVSAMLDKTSFNPQNQVYRAVCMFLEQLGTPVGQVTSGKKKLEGTAFALQLMEQEGISFPTPKKREKKEETSEDEVEVEV